MSSTNYNCTICNKLYKSYQSLWNHNKKFHVDKNVARNIVIINDSVDNNTAVQESNLLVTKSNLLVTKSNLSLQCKYCHKIFNHKQNKYVHQKNVCESKYKKKAEEINKIKQEKELAKIQLQVKKEETKILQLQIKLQKSNKIDNMTVKKLNKLLTLHNNRIKNINSNNNNNTINNNQQIINNNFQVVSFGKEEIIETLTNYEKRMIMSAKYKSLDKLIEIVHCGKYNQFKNIIITNMKDNYMYKYDDKLGHFILSTKADILNSLIEYRLGDLEIIYNDLLENNKLDNRTKDIIEKFVNKINSESKYTDFDGKEHDNYKQCKINEIKILLFNNQEKITNDISLLLTTDEVTPQPVIPDQVTI